MNITVKAPHDWPYEIDRKAVGEAAIDMGIKRDIHIEVCSSAAFPGNVAAVLRALLFGEDKKGIPLTEGRFDETRSLKQNVIELADDQPDRLLTPEEMTIGLLHEMAHAVQFEALGTSIAKAQAAYEAANKRGYEHNSMEEEAQHKAEAEERSHKFRLICATGTLIHA